MTPRPSHRIAAVSGPVRGLFLAALIPGSLGLLLGCSTHGPVASLTSSAAPAPAGAREPVRHASLVERHEAGGGDARKVEQILHRMEASYSAGQASLLAGDEEAAFDSFDDALDAVLRSDVDLDAHPDVKDRAEQVIAAIHEIAVAAAEDVAEEAPGIPQLEDDEYGAAAVATSTLCCPDLTIPMVSHPAVDSMVRFYTGRAKERFELGLSRYGKYAPTVARILEEEGVPGEIAWLALVESNYNPQAYSRARAKGLWQFIPSTGRRYDLDQDFWVDERADFEKATRSAARYLKFLHGMFGDWHLALASYNAGEGKIGRAIKSTGRRDFWKIRETRYIRRETKDYVPAFLAIVQVVRNPSAYGIDFKPSPPLQWETTTIRSATDLSVIAQCSGTTLEMVQDLNPELRRGTTPGGDAPYTLRIPRGARPVFEEKYAALPPEQRLTWHRHVVRSGDTVAHIAQKYGSSTGAVMAANRLSSASRLSPGQSLLIPAGPSIDSVPAAVLASRAPHGSAEPDAPTGARRITYRVRPGDTLGKIASRHGTSIARLAEWNGLRNKNRIHVGQRLTIYGRGSSPASSGSSTRSASGRSSVHVVRPGDTLSAIARKHGMSLSQLRRLNGLGSSSMIRPGQKLRITPSGRSASLDTLDTTAPTLVSPTAVAVIAMNAMNAPASPGGPAPAHH